MTRSDSIPVFRGRARLPAQVLVVAVSACMVAAGMPQPAHAAPSLPRGEATADAAARPAHVAAAPRAGEEAPLLAMGAMSGWSDPDSTEFNFPEDQNKHLARDITAWIIASVFVAFFIVEVFLKGDEPSTPSQKPPGKTIPNP